ncbi:hypothetical protein [Pseudomonas sp. NPDC086251]|uniref:hypothetical protein n=1 Tax=Pseudomonas sp. NPDC086251 TaxID=3364431 RepID=UPI0038364D50
MTKKFTSPITHPNIAAQEILACLVEAGSFSPHDRFLSGSADGDRAADAMIAVHKALSAYYASLLK